MGEFNVQNDKPISYAAYWNNSIRMESSSGGIFSALAEHILSYNGVVYGVAMTEDCKDAVFVRVCDRKNLYQLRGSKYLQAKVGNTFKSVKDDLERGKNVLFTGTGCQVNGLKAFLQKDYDNLFCVDVICHGVPSHKVWRKYIEEKEKELGGRIVNVGFRCKDNGWANFGMKLVNDSNKIQFIPMRDDPYMKLFLKDQILRPSCYECVAKKKKMSDMTIADFWGIDNVASELNDGNGTSLVLLRNQKGITLFNNIKSVLIEKQVDYEEGVKYNPSEYKSVRRPDTRDSVWREINSMSLKALADKYCRDSNIVTLKRFIKLVLKKCHLRRG